MPVVYLAIHLLGEIRSAGLGLVVANGSRPNTLRSVHYTTFALERLHLLPWR